MTNVRTMCLVAVTALLAWTAPADAEDVAQATVAVPYEIRLDGNPTTGYEWRYDPAASENPDLVDVAADGYGSPETSMAGAPATFAFTITPLAAGTATLVFTYGRPWEDEPARREEHRVEITP